MALRQFNFYQITAIVCLTLFLNYVLFLSSKTKSFNFIESTCPKGDDSIPEKTKPCPLVSPYLKHRVDIIQAAISMSDVEFQLDWVHPGGQWHPNDCAPAQKIAIIIPYRDRADHLALFLLNLHPFLKRQQRDYRIFVVEQIGDEPFNRGSLMNVGFVEALKMTDFDCFFFHDVDMVPEDDRNLYSCGDMPKHMAVSISNRGYLLMYDQYFGGVEAMSKCHYELINGFGNCYWGWGSEDDDLFHRVKYHNLTISRYFKDVARYTTFNHVKNKRLVPKRKVFSHREKYYMTSGLNNMNYTLIRIEEDLLFTRLVVDIKNMYIPLPPD